MKILASAVLAVVLSAGAFAQHHGGGGSRGFGGGGHMNGGGHMDGGGHVIAPPLAVTGVVPFRTYGSPSGFGNVVFPGTGTPPPFTPNFSFPFTGAFVFPSTFADRLGATVSGFPGFTGEPSTFGHFDRFGGFGGFGYGNSAAIPYPVPVYGGGYDNGYGQQQQPNVTIVMPPQQYAAPGAPVTINQNFLPEGSRPVIQEYGPSAQQSAPQQSSGLRMYQAPSAAQAQQADDDQVMFLIALKDSSVYSAVAYWVQGDTLNYITPQGKRNQVSLALVDRGLSAKLNSGRKVDFQLPDGR